MADSAWRRRIGSATENGMLKGSAVIGLVGAGVVLGAPRATSLTVFILLSLGCHGPLSPFLPATFEPILLFYGQLHSPLIVALLGALSSVAAEYLNYHIYRALLNCHSLGRVMASDAARPVTILFGRHPFLAVWTCAWSPLPDWAARILTAHARYPVERYLAAFFLGRVPKFWLVAQIGFYWRPTTSTVVSIAVASALLTLFGMLRRPSNSMSSAVPSRPAKIAPGTAMTLAVGLILGSVTSSELLGQRPTSVLLQGNAQGVSFDRFVYDGSGTTAFTFRYSGLRPGGAGPEIGVSLFPQGIPAGALILAPDIGGSHNLSLPGVTLLLKAGGSAIAGFAEDAVFVPGFHFGGGLVVRIDDRTGIRVDLIRHYYVRQNETEPIWSAGLGFTALPRIR